MSHGDATAERMWGKDGGRLGIHRDTSKATKHSPEREIGARAARPILGRKWWRSGDEAPELVRIARHAKGCHAVAILTFIEEDRE